MERERGGGGCAQASMPSTPSVVCAEHIDGMSATCLLDLTCARLSIRRNIE